MMLFSPVNWSSIENLHKYSGEGMLTSMYVYAGEFEYLCHIDDGD